MQRRAGMARLQRPPTLKEIVMRSLLSYREPADTIVDSDDDRPTVEVPPPRVEATSPPQ
jgi:hypothetical protein